jgi:hypothetical protein
MWPSEVGRNRPPNLRDCRLAAGRDFCGALEHGVAVSQGMLLEFVIVIRNLHGVRHLRYRNDGAAFRSFYRPHLRGIPFEG